MKPEWLPMRTNGFCGCWYGVHCDTNDYFVQACEAEVLARHSSSVAVEKFTAGYSNDELLRHFASCRLGALINRQDRGLLEQYEQELVSQLHLVFEVQQRGRWTAR